jgi:hypothetical protein
MNEKITNVTAMEGTKSDADVHKVCVVNVEKPNALTLFFECMETDYSERRLCFVPTKDERLNPFGRAYPADVAKSISPEELYERAEEIRKAKGKDEQTRLPEYDPRKDPFRIYFERQIIPSRGSPDERRTRCCLCGTILYPGNSPRPFPGHSKIIYTDTTSFVICDACQENPLRKGHSRESLDFVSEKIKEMISEAERIRKSISRESKGLTDYHSQNPRRRRRDIGPIAADFVLRNLRKPPGIVPSINIEELARFVYKYNLVFLRFRDPNKLLFDIAQQIYLIIYDLCKRKPGQTASYYKEYGSKWVRRYINSGCFDPDKRCYAAENRTWRKTEIYYDPEHSEAEYFDASEQITYIKETPICNEDAIFKQRDIDRALAYVDYYHLQAHEPLWPIPTETKPQKKEGRKEDIPKIWSARLPHFGYYMNPLYNPIMGGKYIPYLVFYNIRFTPRQFQLARMLFSGDSFEEAISQFKFLYKSYKTDELKKIDEKYLPYDYVLRLRNNNRLPVNIKDFEIIRAARRRVQATGDDKTTTLLLSEEKKIYRLIQKQSEKLDDLVFGISNVTDRDEKEPGVLERREINIPEESDNSKRARDYRHYLSYWKYWAHLFSKTAWHGPASAPTCFIPPIRKENSEILDYPGQIISTRISYRAPEWYFSREDYFFPLSRDLPSHKKDTGAPFDSMGSPPQKWETPRIIRSRSYKYLAGDWYLPYHGKYRIDEEYFDMDAKSLRSKGMKIYTPFFDKIQQSAEYYKDFIITSEILHLAQTGLILKYGYSIPKIKMCHLAERIVLLPHNVQLYNNGGLYNDCYWSLDITETSKWNGDINSKHTYDNELWYSERGRKIGDYSNKIFIVDSGGRYIVPKSNEGKLNKNFSNTELAQKRISDIKEILSRKNPHVSVPSKWPILTTGGFGFIYDDGHIEKPNKDSDIAGGVI